MCLILKPLTGRSVFASRCELKLAVVSLYENNQRNRGFLLRFSPLTVTDSCIFSSTMSGHGHGHGHGHGCGCEGEHEPAERGLEYGLYRRIDVEKVQCLNESRDGDGKLVFKPWDQRNDRDKVTATESVPPLRYPVSPRVAGSMQVRGEGRCAGFL